MKRGFVGVGSGNGGLCGRGGVSGERGGWSESSSRSTQVMSGGLVAVSHQSFSLLPGPVKVGGVGHVQSSRRRERISFFAARVCWRVFVLSARSG